MPRRTNQPVKQTDHAYNDVVDTTTEASPISSEHKRNKTPKPRNSEARKEQNRIASRAYREKRKQKLALLDQILNIEDADLSPDSPSEVDAISQNGLSAAVSSRETSQSPVPATLASSSITTAPPSLSWLSTASSPALVGTDIGFPRNSAAGDPGYTFDSSDMWCTGYDYHDTSNIDNSVDAHPSTFQGTDHQDFMTATTAYPSQAPYNNTTEYATSPAALQHLHHHHHHLIPSLNAPPQPGSLGTGEMYHDDNTTSTWLSSTSSSSKDATSASSSQPLAAALTAFSHLSPAQQDQMLDMIYRQRGEACSERVPSTLASIAPRRLRLVSKNYARSSVTKVDGT